MGQVLIAGVDRHSWEKQQLTNNSLYRFDLTTDINQTLKIFRGRDRMVVGFITKYRCNQCISPLKLWVRIPTRRDVLDTTLCDEACQWLATGRWFSPGTPVSFTNKTDRHDITEKLLKMALNTINLYIYTLINSVPEDLQQQWKR